MTKESARRTELVRAQLSRQEARAHNASEEEFIASMAIETRVELLSSDDDLPRIAELFGRTTQFNTTGIKFSASELSELLRDPAVRIFAAYVKDRFNDHGLVGAAVTRGEEITGLVLSCRVLGTGVEHKFLQHIMHAMASDHDFISGRIIETSRNIPVRNLYRDNGFVQDQGTWRRLLKGETPVAIRR
jgi:FkbH-like protein